MFAAYTSLPSLPLINSLIIARCRLLPVKENFLCRSAFKGAAKLTKEDISRVFSLYDRVSAQRLLVHCVEINLIAGSRVGIYQSITE